MAEVLKDHMVECVQKRKSVENILTNAEALNFYENYFEAADIIDI